MCYLLSVGLVLIVSIIFANWSTPWPKNIRNEELWDSLIIIECLKDLYTLFESTSKKIIKS